MTFETERLILRPWEESDAESLYFYASDPSVGPIAGWPVHTSVENSRKIIKNVLSAPETYAVCLKDDNKAVGSVGLIFPMQSHTKISPSELEIGYWIGKPLWGRGLIPEAVRRIQKYAFDELGCSAVWCGYYDGNEKSKRVQEKCGFLYHHTEKDKFCPLTGDMRTEHFTLITREQWQSGIVIRTLSASEVPDGVRLIWDVFSRFEAPVYSEKGIRDFRSNLDNSDLMTSMKWYGAFDGAELIGVMAIREPLQHIGGFFVKGEYHRRGIGRRLFCRMRQDHEKQEFTVNASPCAIEVYRHLGFVPTDCEQQVDGMRYTPMRFSAP